MEVIEQVPEPHMANVWELSDQGFKTTRIHMLRALMGKDSLQEWMGDAGRKMGILRKNHKDM